jgi:tetratricopeptide (TPR) repeat protein
MLLNALTMPRALCLFIILTFSCVLSSAQKKNIDSLIRVTETLSDTDTTKIFNYCDIALTFGHLSEFEKAAIYIQKAGKLISGFSNEHIRALYFYSAGYINYSTQNYKEAISYLLDAVKLYEKLNYQQRLAACYTVIGLTYHDQTFYDKAELYLQRALSIRIQKGDSMRLPGTYSNIGLNYTKWAQKKHVEGVDCFETREAIKNYKLALSIAQHFNIVAQEASALGNLSNLLNDQKKFSEALKYAEKALEIYKSLDDQYEIAISLIDIGSVYLAQSKYKEGIPYFESSLKIALENDFEELQRYNYSNLRQAFEKTGNYKEAYVNLYKEKALHDSVFNKENLRQINEMQVKYETEKKDAENALLLVKNELSDKAIKNQKNIIIFSVAGLVLALVFAFFIFRGLKKQKHANLIISQQKKDVEDKNILIHRQHELLEDKQKEIVDSINYAKRIQGAHLPTDKYINRSLGRLKK